MQEMRQFLAFRGAVRGGLSPEALVEKHAAKEQAQLDECMKHLISQLKELIEADTDRREELLKEAQELGPKEAKLYCSQLSERVKDLKETITKLEIEFNSAEQTAKGLSAQNIEAAAAVSHLRILLKRKQDKQSQQLDEACKAGGAFCQYVGAQ